VSKASSILIDIFEYAVGVVFVSVIAAQIIARYPDRRRAVQVRAAFLALWSLGVVLSVAVDATR
jgi:hypothetical protein